MTPRELLLQTTAAFRQAGIPDPEVDGALLLSHLTGKAPLMLRLDNDTQLADDVMERFLALSEKRLQRVPLQYLTGEAYFLGQLFHVDERVLIPRPETELLVERAIAALQRFPVPTALDLCCGSGCIGITLAKNREDAQVTLLELSNDAGDYCQKNIEQNGAKNATLFMRDILEGPKDFCELDMIVSNPPYIPAEDMKTLSREVQAEPQMALLGGEDGLDFYRFIISHWTPALKSTGAMVLEVGIHQADAVEQLLSEQFEQVYIVPDLNNIPRVLLGDTRK